MRARSARSLVRRRCAKRSDTTPPRDGIDTAPFDGDRGRGQMDDRIPIRTILHSSSCASNGTTPPSRRLTRNPDRVDACRTDNSRGVEDTLSVIGPAARENVVRTVQRSASDLHVEWTISMRNRLRRIARTARSAHEQLILDAPLRTIYELRARSQLDSVEQHPARRRNLKKPMPRSLKPSHDFPNFEAANRRVLMRSGEARFQSLVDEQPRQIQ